MLPSVQKLKEITEKLQKILRIQDWDIEVLLVSDAEMTIEYGENCSGGCQRKRNSKEARILINTENYRLSTQENYWYHTLLHELYHVVTDTLIFAVDDAREYIKNKKVRHEIKETTNIKYEELVNQLAKGFVNAYPVTNFIKEGE